MAPHENPNGGAATAPYIPVLPAKKDDDLSEEDLALKELLELYVARVQDSDPGVQRLALESIRQEIRSATSLMTSVPKVLKFLRPHYGTLKSYFESMPESDLKKYMADILSVLALTMSVDGERESLRYRLLGSEGDIGSWGHEYVRNLTGQIVQEFQKRQHNAEREAIDLLMKFGGLDLLTDDPILEKQFSYIIARYGLDGVIGDKIVADENYKEVLQEIVNNSKLSQGWSVQWRPTPSKMEKAIQYMKRAWDRSAIKRSCLYAIQRLRDRLKGSKGSDEGNEDIEAGEHDSSGSRKDSLGGSKEDSIGRNKESIYQHYDNNAEEDGGENIFDTKDDSFSSNKENNYKLANQDGGKGSSVSKKESNPGGRNNEEFEIKEELLKDAIHILDALRRNINLNMGPTPEPWEDFLGFPSLV